MSADASPDTQLQIRFLADVLGKAAAHMACLRGDPQGVQAVGPGPALAVTWTELL